MRPVAPVVLENWLESLTPQVTPPYTKAGS